MFVPSKLTSGRPMSGNIALSLWEKKREQDEWEDIEDQTKIYLSQSIKIPD